MRVCEQQPPLRAVRAFPLPHGETLVHLHNVSGGVLGGDRLELRVDLGPGAAAQLTSTGATRLYRHRPDTPAARQSVDVAIGEGALLEYVPDPLIPFAGSRYRQKVRIDLSPDAGLFWWDVVAPGRDARGELFAYDLLECELEIAAGGKPVATERMRLEPGLRPMDSPARLGPFRYLASFFICREGLAPGAWLALESRMAELAEQLSRPPELVWGASALPAHGLVVRALGVGGRDIASGLHEFWRAAKRELYGREAIPPRKVL